MPENVWILARHGARCGAGDAVELQLRAAESATDAGLYLHGPARLQAGPHGAHQGSCAAKKDDTLQLPQGWTPTLQVTDAITRRVFKSDCPFGARNADGGSDLAADAALGYYSIQLTAIAV